MANEPGRELIAKWRDAECTHSQADISHCLAICDACAELHNCANELEAALAARSSSETGARRNWKGIAWKDSIRARNLAEEISLHFAHDCNDSECGEDADTSNCETAWIEDKLTEFLEFVVIGEDRQP